MSVLYWLQLFREDYLLISAFWLRMASVIRSQFFTGANKDFLCLTVMVFLFFLFEGVCGGLRSLLYTSYPLNMFVKNLSSFWTTVSFRSWERSKLCFCLLSLLVTSTCPESKVHKLVIKNWLIWTGEVSSFDWTYND